VLRIWDLVAVGTGLLGRIARLGRGEMLTFHGAIDMLGLAEGRIRRLVLEILWASALVRLRLAL
jgi:hypothetical protein